jgi:hypothetical protein
MQTSRIGTFFALHALGTNGVKLNHTRSMSLTLSYNITRFQRCCQSCSENVRILLLLFELPLYKQAYIGLEFGQKLGCYPHLYASWTGRCENDNSVSQMTLAYQWQGVRTEWVCAGNILEKKFLSCCRCLGKSKIDVGILEPSSSFNFTSGVAERLDWRC